MLYINQSYSGTDSDQINEEHTKEGYGMHQWR